MGRKFVNKIGVEAEFFIINSKKEIIIPPGYFDRDDFPIFGEIRGEPGQSVAETIANFTRARIKAEENISESHSMIFDSYARIKLDTYRKAMKQVTKPKNEMVGKTLNIYGTKIDEFSDQIIEKGKIQGIWASTGLHIHFSSVIEDECEVKEAEYEPVHLPISLGDVKTTLNLYRHEGYTTKKTIKVTASQLNYPTTYWLVEQMDKKFFDRFVPNKDKRTKYRHPGYYELKDYGFEYRSLPASNETMESLREIVSYSFELLKDLNDFDV